ncbi:MAG: CRISPR-associated endonuclease Cas6 [Bacteroidota bacterium]
MLEQEAPIIKMLHAHFDLEITRRELVNWRGAISEVAGAEFDLFHNHKPDGSFIYRYPRIQYRRFRNKAALLAINEGIDQLQSFLASREWVIRWKDEERQLKIEEIYPKQRRLLKTEDFHNYQILNWIALNQENYIEWKSLPGMVERIQYLEKILANNIIALAKGLSWTIPSKFKLQITNMDEGHKIYHKGTPLIAFDVTFRVDLMLADYLALGKAVSHGFGIFSRVKRSYF